MQAGKQGPMTKALFPANPKPLWPTRSRPRGHGAAERALACGRDLPPSLRYAAQGLAHGFLTQRNFRIRCGGGGRSPSALGLWLQLSPGPMAVLVLTVTRCCVLELINTAIESVGGSVPSGRRFHPLARIAKGIAPQRRAGGRR